MIKPVREEYRMGFEEEKEARMLAQEQLTALRKHHAKYGLMIDAALAGEKRNDEPENDGRLKAIRAMALKLQEE